MAKVQKKTARQAAPAQDPLWYKDAIIYELHVRAFADGNGDGSGDFQGLTGKLDYLQDLGVTALWLLPFYPSPLKDDGYDISDYTDIHPDYGTLQDFRLFLRAAHERGMRVITELVINHTSDQHPWFQRARKAASGSKTRDFYVWSDSQEKYHEARIIFKDFEPSNWSWDPLAKAYYWHRFYSHQPDLNFDNPAVRRAIFDVLDFWLGMGVDGLRLDAVPYLYEREGTSCENLQETHSFLKELRRHVEQNYQGRMLLAEANQWPEDAAAYFGAGDECHMAFHFPVMPRLFMGVHMENRFPIIDILTQTPRIPETSQWALFLRNHDELTLEMVTDEDRDYMYQVYATDPQARINLGIRRRLAPLLGNNRRKMELLQSLLFSLPGTPVLYYGDEIAMGDNYYLGDRNGVRTPMQWSADRNAGFSRANPQRLFLPVIIDPEHHYETYNVDAQQQNLSSFLWWVKRLIALRKRYRAFGQGDTEFFYPRNRKVLVFTRNFKEERILVVANLSRFVQYAELDLSPFKGMVPLELFGQTEFPSIGDLPYFITLGPHGFYWFKLEPPPRSESRAEATAAKMPSIQVSGSWNGVFNGAGRMALERILSAYLRACRWFGGKARRLRNVSLIDAVPFKYHEAAVYLVTVEIQYHEGSSETYLLPLGFATQERMRELRQAQSDTIVADLTVESAGEQPEEGILYDASFDDGFARGLLDAIARRRVFKGQSAEIAGIPTRAFRRTAGSQPSSLQPAPLRREQSNTSIRYGDRLVLKLFRRLEEGINPDLEIGRFLTERTSFRHVPPLAGHMELRRGKRDPMAMAILQGWVANEGDAWSYTLDQLKHYFENAQARRSEEMEVPARENHLLDWLDQEMPPLAQDIIGPYLTSAILLGQRTAELHAALASDSSDPAFAPESFTVHYRQSLYQSMRTLASNALVLLRDRINDLPENARGNAAELLGMEHRILGRFRAVLDRKITAMRLRVHGDYHLGQVLYTGKDFVILDFEGEPARPLSERRLKRSPLKDVAGMLRSFSYATSFALRSGSIRPEDRVVLERWGRYWQIWVSVAFVKCYLATTAQAGFLPKSRDEMKVLLDLFILEKSIYELAYELNNRPDWVDVPLQGIREIMQTGS
jgi:maltose alpha-D-glucosyltransferase/alpha-amylase